MSKFSQFMLITIGLGILTMMLPFILPPTFFSVLFVSLILVASYFTLYLGMCSVGHK